MKNFIWIWIITSDEEISVFLQSLAVFSHHVVKAEVQLIEGESLLGVCSSFSCWVVVRLLQRTQGYLEPVITF